MKKGDGSCSYGSNVLLDRQLLSVKSKSEEAFSLLAQKPYWFQVNTWHVSHVLAEVELYC